MTYLECCASRYAATEAAVPPNRKTGTWEEKPKKSCYPQELVGKMRFVAVKPFNNRHFFQSANIPQRCWICCSTLIRLPFVLKILQHRARPFGSYTQEAQVSTKSVVRANSNAFLCPSCRCSHGNSLRLLKSSFPSILSPLLFFRKM